jgi:hypothetical protein
MKPIDEYPLLCTVMVPSRKRPDGLIRVVNSITASADRGDYEVLVRVDEDDHVSIALKEQLESNPHVKVSVGKRLGYDRLDTGYYTELAKAGGGRWVWIMNDDMVVSGPWCSELIKVPLSGFYGQPGTHQLNKSAYGNDTRSGCPLFVQGCWEFAGWDCIPMKADYILTAKLEELGWHAAFLNHVKVWHDWAGSDANIAHHKL